MRVRISIIRQGTLIYDTRVTCTLYTEETRRCLAEVCRYSERRGETEPIRTLRPNAPPPHRHHRQVTGFRVPLPPHHTSNYHVPLLTFTNAFAIQNVRRNLYLYVGIATESVTNGV